MASISANGSLGHHKFTLTVTESSTSVANNTSTVKYSFQLSPVQTSWAWSSWGSSISYTITINGTKYTGTIPNYDGYATVTLKSGSQTVTHSSDGSKSISYSFSVVDGAGQRYTPGNASASGTLALTTIPRATTPTLSASSITVNGSNSVNIVIKPASSSFKHKIRYAFGSLTGLYSGVSIGSGFSAKGDVTVKFTPPTSALNQIPSATSGTCTITCYTYTSDGTSVGTKTIKLTFNVPSYTPTASVKLTGNKLLSGTYVAGKSTVTVETTASTSYGASIKSYSCTVNGKVYTGSKFTTAPLLKEENKTIQVTVTDTRGETFLAKASAITIYEYFAPKITEFSVARQSDGTTVVATIKGSIAPINNKNTKEITIGINYNGYTNYINVDGYNIDTTSTFVSIPTDSTFVGTVSIKDSYTSVQKTYTLPTVAVTMDFHHSGKGVAFGKVAENENLLEVKWDAKFGGKLYDPKGNDMFYDSGWQTVSFGSNPFTHYSNESTMQYRRVGKQVYVRGSMKPTKTIDTSTSTVAFVLPEGFRPSQPERFLCQGSVANKWMCEVSAGGSFLVSRYGTTDFGSISTSTWLPMSISFLVG